LKAFCPEHPIDRNELLAAVSGRHGLAVLGMQGPQVQLYDPARASRKALSLEDFRKNFQAVPHGR